MDSKARTNLLKRVETDAARAVQIIEKARADKSGEAVVRCGARWPGRAGRLCCRRRSRLAAAAAHVRCSRLRCSAISTCQGVAFLFVSKIGLGLGMDNGHGFVIKRRPVRRSPARLNVGSDGTSGSTVCLAAACEPLVWKIWIRPSATPTYPLPAMQTFSGG